MTAAARGLGPTFAIAGAARAGSTAVAEALRAHPDGFVTQPKEPHYFAFAGQEIQFTGPGDDATINRVAVTQEPAYLKLYEAGADCAVRGEGSVSTLYYHDQAVPVMRAMNADMRVVVLLRDPVARAYSSYQYLRVRGMEQLEDFLEAVEQEPVRIRAGWHHLWHYTSMSRYASSVAHLLDAFGPARVGVWFYDDLVSSPEQCLGQIQRFVGLDPQRAPSPSPRRVNVSGRPRRVQLQSAIAWASGHEPVRQALKRVVPFGVRERIRAANLEPQGVPDLAREELAPAFAEDLDRLAQVLGRSLPRWR